MAHAVFVSHSVKDKAVADKIVARLEADGVNCWVAPRDVVPGADWGESIIDAIESSRIMVLVFSAAANASSQIKREVERAVDKNVYTIPFRIDDIEPKKSLEYFISTSQWMDAFPPPLEQHLDKLAYTVKAILARPAEGEDGDAKASAPVQRQETPMPPRDTFPGTPSWLKPAAVLAAVLLLIGMAIWFMNQPGKSRVEQKQPGDILAARERTSRLRWTPTPIGLPPMPPSKSEPAPASGAEAPISDAPANALPQPPVKTEDEIARPLNAPNTAAAANLANIRKFPASNAAALAAEDPASVVRRYYDSINRRDLNQAFDCLSKGFKTHRPREQFSKTFAATRAIAIRQLDEASRDEAKVVFNIVFAETDAENRSHEWEGKVTLVNEDGAWRINGTQLNRR